MYYMTWFLHRLNKSGSNSDAWGTSLVVITCQLSIGEQVSLYSMREVINPFKLLTILKSLIRRRIVRNVDAAPNVIRNFGRSDNTASL